MAIGAKQRTRGGVKGTYIEGLDELLAQLDGLQTEAIAGSIADGIEAGAKRAADIIEQEAPRGPSGNLKRAVQYGVFKQRAGKPVAGFVRVDRKIAPHLHLVEFGARGGNMPDNPFFSRGWRKSRTGVESELIGSVQAAIDKAIK